MVHPLGIAGDFFADDAGGIGIILGAADPADGGIVDDVHIQRAGGWAIMRADRTGGTEGDGLVHGWRLAEGRTALN
ncbi:hypothetical protein D3C86_2077820 [compost metagenome]